MWLLCISYVNLVCTRTDRRGIGTMTVAALLTIFGMFPLAITMLRGLLKGDFDQYPPAAIFIPCLGILCGYICALYILIG